MLARRASKHHEARRVCRRDQGLTAATEMQPNDQQNFGASNRVLAILALAVRLVLTIVITFRATRVSG